MFWGLNLKPNRKYTQTTAKSFHISHAAIDGEPECTNKIFITVENEKFLLCTLKKNVVDQVMLDLNFAKGDDICFQSVGNGNVSLSGYINDDFDEDDFGEEEEEGDESDTDIAALLNGNGKAVSKKGKKEKASKKSQGEENDKDSDDSESDDEDFTLDTTGLEAADDSDDDDDEEEDDDEDEDEEDDDDSDEENEEDDDEEVQEPKNKQPKLDKQAKNQKPKEKAQPSSAEKKNDKKEKKNEQANQKQEKSQQKSGERTIAGGVKVEDIKLGNGPEAKTGKRASVYYEGRLKTNNKMFDSLKNGAPFKFAIGKGEVIKGWEIGVAGMKVGGKRRITCPPHMAYGQRGSPPQIPPNSTLVFEVELKGVN